MPSADRVDRATVRLVRRAMDVAGVSLDSLAAVTGIPASTMRRHMNGAKSFTIRELGLIARVLECRVSELVAEMPPAPAATPPDDPGGSTLLEHLARRSRTALDDRVRFERALGMAAVRLGVDADRAAALLDRHARAHGLSLVALSERIAGGTFDWTELRAAAERAPDRGARE